MDVYTGEGRLPDTHPTLRGLEDTGNVTVVDMMGATGVGDREGGGETWLRGYRIHVHLGMWFCLPCHGLSHIVSSFTTLSHFPSRLSLHSHYIYPLNTLPLSPTHIRLFPASLLSPPSPLFLSLFLPPSPHHPSICRQSVKCYHTSPCTHLLLWHRSKSLKIRARKSNSPYWEGP